MTLSLDKHADADVVRVAQPRIDAAAAIQFKDDMRALLARGADRVILDLREVDFVDSSGLGAIIAVMKMLKTPRRMELAGLSPNVDKVFRLTRMDKVFVIHDDLAAGLDSDAA